MNRLALSILITLFVSPLGCTEERGLGGPCESNEECLSGLICLTDLPGGMCSRACEDDDCPDDAECVDLAGDHYCLPSCSDGFDCRNAYGCSMGHCDLPCEDDEECPAYAECDPDARGCSLFEDQPQGGACRDDLQCSSGNCFIENEEDGEGVCLERCGGSELCDDGMVCGALWEGSTPTALCRPPAGSRAAGDLCGDGTDCASGICAFGACVYPCGSETGCQNGGVCQMDDVDIEGDSGVMSYCESTAAPGVRTLDFGALTTERGVVHVEFDVPENTVSFAVIAWTDVHAVLQARNFERPDGETLINDTGAGFIRVFDQEWVTTILVPNTDIDEAFPVPGLHTLDLLAYNPESTLLMDAEIYVRVLFKIRENGRLNEADMVLNIHIAPRVFGPLSATNAAESPYIQTILERVQLFYDDECNTPLYDVRYFDLEGDFSMIGSDEELRDMMEEGSAGAPRASANVFLVRDLSGVSEWLAGISGGLPGPPGLNGTRRSGVAMAAQEDAEAAGDVLAHEIGHFYGLFHPTEMDGWMQDTISDTPPCNFDAYDYHAMGTCRTIWNIMFPVLTGLADEISPGQCKVVRGYPGL